MIKFCLDYISKTCLSLLVCCATSPEFSSEKVEINLKTCCVAGASCSSGTARSMVRLPGFMVYIHPSRICNYQFSKTCTILILGTQTLSFNKYQIFYLKTLGNVSQRLS